MVPLPELGGRHKLPLRTKVVFIRSEIATYIAKIDTESTGLPAAMNASGS